MTAPAPVDPGTPPVAPTSVPAPPAQAAQPPTPPDTAAPVAETTAQPKGPIPYERHESILKNAREKTTAEVTRQFQQQYGPSLELGQRINADPVGTVVGLIQGLAEHPDHGQAVISALARTLGSRRGQAAQDQEPQADLQAPDGTQVYSAERLAQIRAYDRQQILKEVDQRFDQRVQPLQQREQQRLAVERQTQETQAANDRMARVLEPYKQLLGPHFETHKPALRTKTAEYVEAGYDAQTALGLAVSSILHSTVTPARVAESQQQLMAQAVAKSTGSTSPPGAAPSAPAARPTSFEEAFTRGVRI